MSQLGDTTLLVHLPTGGRAVYAVQPQHLPREDIAESAMWPLQYGRQVAHEIDGHWYRPDGWTPVGDPRLVALFERCPRVN